MPPTTTNADVHCSPLAELHDDWENASKYLSMFIDEAQHTVDEITDALLALEAGGRRPCATHLLTAVHRLKGSSAAIGLHRVAKLAHLTEDLLQEVVEGGGEPTPEICELLLTFADGLRKYVDRLKTGTCDDAPFDALADRLAAAASPLHSGEGPGVRATSNSPQTGIVSPANSPQPNPLPKGEVTDKRSQLGEDLHRRVAAAVCEDQQETTLVGKVVFQPDLPLAGLKARLLYEKLSNLGTVRYFDPPAEGVESLDDLEEVLFGLVTEKSPETLRRHVRVAGIERMAIEPLAAGALAAERPETPSDAALKHKPVETLRVEVERLDRLMNNAGQLAIGKSRLSRVARELKRAVSGNRTAEILVGELSETLHALDRVCDDVQQGTMDMRMTPIGPLLNRFHRVVRDVARASGKIVRLTVRGENTELDKRMIDELGDPLIHLVRNAADHGIESPEDRAAANKPPQGTIAVEAFHRGGKVFIRLSDDGRGIDTPRLREKAVEKGLISAADAERMTHRQMLQLVWLPGLSTAEKISDVSGRGMGMDIVRSRIAELSGTVELESEAGRGATVLITLPLTLAILPSLIVEVRGEPLAIPLESVAEIVKVGPDDVTDVLGRRTVLVRGRVVPIVTLAALFGEHRDEESDDCGPADATLVVLGQGKRRLGLPVDRVFGEEEVVVKSLAANWRDVPGIAGASIFGDGRVCLILDPPTLIEMSSHNTSFSASTWENT